MPIAPLGASPWDTLKSSRYRVSFRHCLLRRPSADSLMRIDVIRCSFQPAPHGFGGFPALRFILLCSTNLNSFISTDYPVRSGCSYVFLSLQNGWPFFHPGQKLKLNLGTSAIYSRTIRRIRTKYCSKVGEPCLWHPIPTMGSTRFKSGHQNRK